MNFSITLSEIAFYLYEPAILKLYSLNSYLLYNILLIGTVSQDITSVTGGSHTGPNIPLEPNGMAESISHQYVLYSLFV